MLDLKVKILVGIASGLLLIIYMLLISLYWLAKKADKEAKFADCGDVKNCVESSKIIQGKIIGDERTTDESCTLQYCDECSIYANTGTLPPCICGLSDG
ncbi:protein FAM24A-like [Microtus ochrogaster]|uniref:Protein FAM24A-like n=1 Tax=Microtus ochrogaster TaxID=79684 RepID=A0ABM0KR67_MICOH|nr:protein FAM24A-like [Microtus ochrogaster]